MRKSQITLFIVLGIVVMIIFGLLFFVKNRTSDIVLEKRINKIYGDFLSSTGFKEYVSVCLERVTKDGIKLAAAQGGRIYSNQVTGGYDLSGHPEEVLPYEFDGDVYDVSYGIKRPVPNGDNYLAEPDYPYPGILIEDPYTLLTGGIADKRYKFVFGLWEADARSGSLTTLCDKLGPNYWEIERAKHTCETASRTGSMQHYLRLYILEKVKSCVDFDRFAEETKYDVKEGDIGGYVLMGNDDVFVSINYSVEISVEGEPPLTRFTEFTARPKIRLKKVHELASHLIGSFYNGNNPEADASNIFFDIETDPGDCFGDNNVGGQNCIFDVGSVTKMSVSKEEDVCLTDVACDPIDPNLDCGCVEITCVGDETACSNANGWGCNGDDYKNNVRCTKNVCVKSECDGVVAVDSRYAFSNIIKIEDKGSLIDGKSLTFLFAVENRGPTLNEINSPFDRGTDPYTFSNCVDGAGLMGCDPDDEKITYFLSCDGTKKGSNEFEGACTGKVEVRDKSGLRDWQDSVEIN